MEATDPGPCEHWWSIVLSALEARANDGLEPEEGEVERAAISLVGWTMRCVGFTHQQVMDALYESELRIYMSLDIDSGQVVVSADWGEDSFEVSADVTGLM